MAAGILGPNNGFSEPFIPPGNSGAPKRGQDLYRREPRSGMITNEYGLPVPDSTLRDEGHVPRGHTPAFVYIGAGNCHTVSAGERPRACHCIAAIRLAECVE